MPRIKNWTKLNATALWRAWAAQFNSEVEAEATAIFAANRLVKDKARSTKRRFYSIKDEFIRRHLADLVLGQKVRDEIRECWACDGTGEDYGCTCQRCDGTGEYSRRTLYLHRFVIEGSQYAFHSYEAPISLSDEPGEDLESYGGSFSEAELEDLALPMSGLLRMLGYVAVAKWHMQRAGDRYQQRTLADGTTFRDAWQQKLDRWTNGKPTPAGGFRNGV
jgi:hypothetical protein